jgi:hypothetical protein
MGSIFLVLLLTISACGVKRSPVDYGKTTVSDLIAKKGEPLEEKAIPVKDGKILVYPDNEKFQAKGDIVTHGFLTPVGDEKNLIYWKHQFKDCNPRIVKISEAKGHSPAEQSLVCDEFGLTVIYTEGSDSVSRIVEHEKK